MKAVKEEKKGKLLLGGYRLGTSFLENMFDAFFIKRSVKCYDMHQTATRAV